MHCSLPEIADLEEEVLFSFPRLCGLDDLEGKTLIDGFGQESVVLLSIILKKSVSTNTKT